MKLRHIWGASFCVALAACAGTTAANMTPYQDSGSKGSVTAREELDGTWMIIAYLNQSSPMQAAIDYTYLKAAETTKSKASQCFEVISQSNSVARDDSAGYGGVRNTRLEPSSRLHVRILPKDAACTENNADALIALLRPRIADRLFYNSVK